jgi:peroxiredoxin
MTLTIRGMQRLTVVLLSISVVLGPRAVCAETFKPFMLKTLDGEQRSLSSVLGARATLVAFFFPSCPYCNAAFPRVQEIYDTYKNQGLSMVWINVLPDEERLIADWRSRHGFTATILVGPASLADKYDLRMTPTHYLLDAKGKVLWKHAGYKPDDEKALERRIQAAVTGSD